MPAETLVVFDVDDTLYLERDYVASGFAAVAPVARELFGVSGFDTVAWRLFEAGARGTIFDLALAELGVSGSAAQIATLVRAYRHHRPRIALAADADLALAWLRERRLRFALLTDGPEVCQSNKITALGLRPLAAMTVLTDTYGPGFGKPHPRGFTEIAEHSQADRLVYVADNPSKDFAAPRSLGWTTIRVRRPAGLHFARPHGDDVDTVIEDLSAVPAFLSRT